MPTKPKTFSLRGGKPKHHRPSDQWRGPAHERGYDSDWKKLRNDWITESPLCEHCDRNGITTLAFAVDHIVPIAGINDPKRLDWGNLQSLCSRCHAFKTRDQDGYPKTAPSCRVIVVYGPPAAGKTTYVEANRKDCDIVWDWDAEMAAVGGDRSDPPHLVASVKQRQEMFYRRMYGCRGAAWIIQTWRDRALQMAHATGANIVAISTPAETCIERINIDQRRRAVRDKQVAAVYAWHVIQSRAERM